MHRQSNSFAMPCASEQREYVKLQYGRKIAQDTCMLASMKTPDWSHSSPGFIGRHSSVPCTVTTNSSNSNLKMYPYTVYSCACHSDHHHCQKLRSNCTRHRCLSNSAIHVLLPSSSHDPIGMNNQTLLRSQVLEVTARNGLSRPIPLIVPQPTMPKINPITPASNFYLRTPPSHHHNHHHLHQPSSCHPSQNFHTQLIGFPTMSNPSAHHHHHRAALNQDVLQRH
ncbi:hypothetical protein D915_002456 [Fasciola hepatica]|uniref:Uncharacterized protein n=1 Tax=Fasciola hepatica TaxID=6192 RepID=A0A4E0RLH3_FASHE|nr:hypothetical protein D915_002456 [Fasciola hepatica]